MEPTDTPTDTPTETALIEVPVPPEGAHFDLGARVLLRGIHQSKRIVTEGAGVDFAGRPADLIEYEPIVSDRPGIVVGWDGVNRLGVRHTVLFDDGAEAHCDWSDLRAE